MNVKCISTNICRRLGVEDFRHVYACTQVESQSDRHGLVVYNHDDGVINCKAKLGEVFVDPGSPSEPIRHILGSVLLMFWNFYQ